MVIYLAIRVVSPPNLAIQDLDPLTAPTLLNLMPQYHPVEPSGVQALKNPNPLKDVEGLVVLVVAELS